MHPKGKTPPITMPGIGCVYTDWSGIWRGIWLVRTGCSRDYKMNEILVKRNQHYFRANILFFWIRNMLQQKWVAQRLQTKALRWQSVLRMERLQSFLPSIGLSSWQRTIQKQFQGWALKSAAHYSSTWLRQSSCRCERLRIQLEFPGAQTAPSRKSLESHD